MTWWRRSTTSSPTSSAPRRPIHQARARPRRARAARLAIAPSPPRAGARRPSAHISSVPLQYHESSVVVALRTAQRMLRPLRRPRPPLRRKRRQSARRTRMARQGGAPRTPRRATSCGAAPAPARRSWICPSTSTKGERRRISTTCRACCGATPLAAGAQSPTSSGRAPRPLPPRTSATARAGASRRWRQPRFSRRIRPKPSSSATLGTLCSSAPPPSSTSSPTATWAPRSAAQWRRVPCSRGCTPTFPTCSALATPPSRTCQQAAPRPTTVNARFSWPTSPPRPSLMTAAAAERPRAPRASRVAASASSACLAWRAPARPTNRLRSSRRAQRGAAGAPLHRPQAFLLEHAARTRWRRPPSSSLASSASLTATTRAQ
mmetsp:Transcript_17569/g.54756  ORF Transcript_17569/g.54756 Transcript_17569/m.54756 type:complete len:377 (+) Transcript_17569:2880-4010(+)